LILLDTNVWSELTKRQRDPHVVAWLAQNEERLHLSVLVIAEIRRGLELPRGRSFRPKLEAWLGDLEEEYAPRIVNFEAKDAHIFGHLAAQRTLGSKIVDVQLAAQAIARDCPLATRNVQDFAWTGVKLVNPWEG
jgi:toxin FitB